MYDDLLRLTLPEGSRTTDLADDIVVEARAKTTELLKLPTNETMRRISGWMEENSLKMFADETEAVLITDRIIFRTLSLLLTEEDILLKK